ncbi:MAG TPA: hypothetical protein VD816_00925 [Ohtaekwangia sp.]|nr:hypothetical protein [Ohtaekwangia sp.]
MVSIAYFALVSITKDRRDTPYLHASRWFPLSQLPVLIFDHLEMIEKAKEALQKTAAVNPAGFALLPPKFTIPQLRALYEAIYGVKMDKRNFAKKILALNILVKLPEKEKSGSKKGAFYYKFDRDQYNEMLSPGTKRIDAPRQDSVSRTRRVKNNLNFTNMV